MPDKSSEGGRNKMTTEVKPIRPTKLQFNNEKDLREFVDYATSIQKTKSEGIDRMRELLKNHTPAKERK